MNYTLHQLQVFLKVTQLKSITKTAENLHLSQPAVSIQLKNFQDQFEIPLTELIGRKLYITDFGKEIAIAAEKILDEVYAINYKTLAHKGHLAGRLKLSVVSTGKYIMPYFLSGFMQEHPGIELSMDVTNKSEVLISLEKNEVDFSLVSVLPQNILVEKTDLMQNTLYLVGENGHPFNQDYYDLSVFDSLPLIYREAGSGTRHTIEQFMYEHQLPTQKKMELTSNEAVKQAVIAGLGYAIIPLIGIKNELINGELRIINVQGFPLRSTWSLIWLRNKGFSPIAKAFLNYVITNRESIINHKFSWFSEWDHHDQRKR